MLLLAVVGVVLLGWKTEAPEGCPAGGNVRLPGWEIGEGEVLDPPPWLVGGGKRLPGEGLPAAIGGYVLGWRDWKVPVLDRDAESIEASCRRILGMSRRSSSSSMRSGSAYTSPSIVSSAEP